MRLAALCLYGTLLALCDPPWATASSGEGSLHWNKGLGPCFATLRPAGPCGQGPDEDTCPYRVNLPPLTIHLPKQLRELEKFVKEVQKLKDKVDQLRKACADCTLSQNESESGRLTGGESKEEKEGKEKQECERNWMTDRDPEGQKENDRELIEEGGTYRVKEKSGGGEDTDSEKRRILEDMGRKKWGTEGETDKAAVKEKEKEGRDEQSEDVNNHRETGGTNEQSVLRETKVHAGGETERPGDKTREKVTGRNDDERKDAVTEEDEDAEGDVDEDGERRAEGEEEGDVTDEDDEDERERSEGGRRRRPWQGERDGDTTEEAPSGDARGGGRTEATEGRGRADAEEERRGKEEEEERGKEWNDEKTKWTESYGRTERGNEEREAGKEIKTEREKPVQSVQRDSGGELASSKPSEMADVVPPSPRLLSALSPVPKLDGSKSLMFTSPLPSVSSSSSRFITGTNGGYGHSSPVQTTTVSVTSTAFVSSSASKSSTRTTLSLQTRPVEMTILPVPRPGSAGSGTSLTPDRQMTTTSSPETITTGSRLPTQSPSQSRRKNIITAHLSPSQWPRTFSTSSKSTVRSGIRPQRPGEQSMTLDSETAFRSTGKPTTSTAITSPLASTGRKKTSPSTQTSTTTASLRPGDSSQGSMGLNTVTTTTTNPSQSKHTTTSSAKISSKTKSGTKPMPGPEPKPGKKPKLGLKPVPYKKPKSAPDLKPDQTPLPDQMANPDKKPVHSHQKPRTDLRRNPVKKSKPGQIPKPGASPLPDLPKTDQIPKNDQISYHGPDHTTDQEHMPDQTPTSYQKHIPPHQKPTPHEKHLTSKNNNFDLRPKSDQDLLTDQEPKSDEDYISNQKPYNPTKTSKDQRLKPNQKPKTHQKSKSDQRLKINHDSIPDKQPEPKNVSTSNLKPNSDQKPITDIRSNINQDRLPDHELESKQHSTPDPLPNADNTRMPPHQKPKISHNIPETNQRPHLDQKSITDPRPEPDQKPITDQNLGHMPKLEPKHTQFQSPPGQKTKPDVRSTPDQGPPPDQEPKSVQKHKTTSPGQIPQPSPKSIPDQNPEPESNKKPKPRLPLRPWTPTRPNHREKPFQKPRPAVKPKPSLKTTTSFDSSLISRITPDSIHKYNGKTPPTFSPVKKMTELNLSKGDTEFSNVMMTTVSTSPRTSTSPFLKAGLFPLLHAPPAGFTASPNSRSMSDQKTKTTTQPSTIPRTKRPNKRPGDTLHPSIIPITSAGSTTSSVLASPVENNDSSLQTEMSLVQQETTASQTTKPGKMKILSSSPIASTSPQPISTLNQRLRSDYDSTTPATFSPDPPTPSPTPDFTTHSARELRVKINQVAAFLNNPYERPQDKHLKSHPKVDPEGNQGGSKANRTESQLPTQISSKVTTARRDCSDHMIRGEKKSGIYQVTPDARNRTFPVFCDMKLHGGGWTLIQRRQDGSVSFNRTWAEYRAGFGELNGGEFWLGNDKIHLLTQARDMVLRVELEDFEGVRENAQYGQFRVASERQRYRLTVGSYSGSAGDALRFSKMYDHNNKAFTTPDRDHDRYPSGNCGAYYSSGWWFDACMAANLNGRYYVGKYKGVRDGIFWGTWYNISEEYYPTNERQSFKTVKMMIRPKVFAP